MDDTWAWRDLPVLDAVVRQMDEINKTGGFPDGADIAASAGLGVLDVAAALAVSANTPAECADDVWRLAGR
jgi:hypothetical protein